MNTEKKYLQNLNWINCPGSLCAYLESRDIGSYVIKTEFTQAMNFEVLKGHCSPGKVLFQVRYWHWIRHMMIQALRKTQGIILLEMFDYVPHMSIQFRLLLRLRLSQLVFIVLIIFR